MSIRSWFPKAHRRVYLDYASAPPVLPAAQAAMRDAERLFGNPGALHAEAVAAKRSLEASRATIASLLGCKAREVIFTSGLTEANSLAVVGYARHLERIRRTLKDTHWLVSAIEHDSVLRAFCEVERMGGAVDEVRPDARGVITPRAVAAAMRRETVFVSVGWANNEIGTVQPLGEIARAAREAARGFGTHVVMHADAGQAPLYRSTQIESLGVDFLSLGGNKLYGPHGVGALVARGNAGLAPILFGGSQERGLRAGTENVALAAGFAAALVHVAGERDAEGERLKKLRDELARQLQARVPDLVINGSTSLTAGGSLDHALPHMLNVSISRVSTEYLTLALDAAGIAVSTKSACREGEESRSHVVAALEGAERGKGEGEERQERQEWRAQHTIRFSLGRDTTNADVLRVANEVARLTEISSAKVA